MTTSRIGVGGALASMAMALVACEKERARPAATAAMAPSAALAATLDAGVAGAAAPPDAPSDAAPDAAVDAAPRKPLELVTESGSGYFGSESDVHWVQTFLDGNGDNRVEVSIETVVVGQSEMGPESTRRFRLVHAATKDGKTRTLRTVREVEARCAFQLTLALLDLTLADADRDGIGELTFGYQIGCRSDAGPNPMKVFLLENGKKYALRGQSRVRFPDYTDGGDVAERDPDDAPAAIAQALDAFWEANADDLTVGRPEERGEEATD